jgi:tetratricopeptide (TPR) repeat protein
MHILSALIAELLLVTCAIAQSVPDAVQCQSDTAAADERIDACTRVITGGQVAAQDLATAFYRRGNAWSDKHDYGRAIADYTDAIRLNPRNAGEYHNKAAAAYFNRGLEWRAKGDQDRAIADYTEAIRLNPLESRAFGMRGHAWYLKRDIDRAIADFTEAIRLNPQAPFVYVIYEERARAWSDKGDAQQAIADYTTIIRLNPRDPVAYNSAGWLLATSPAADARNGKQAIELAQKACELTAWNEPNYIDTLAAAHAEAGDFDTAIRWQEMAMGFPNFMKSDGDAARARLESYRQKKPYREMPAPLPQPAR